MTEQKKQNVRQKTYCATKHIGVAVSLLLFGASRARVGGAAAAKQQAIETAQNDFAGGGAKEEDRGNSTRLSRKLTGLNHRS